MVVSVIVVLAIASLEIMHMQTSKPVLESNSSSELNSSTIAAHPVSTSVPLAFFLNISSGYFQDNLKVFAKNLKSGDYVIIRGDISDPRAVVEKVKQVKSMFAPGVNVNSCLFYYEIGNIVDTVPKLPTGIDYIVYDYEKGQNYSPEFTENESKSLEYFDQAQDAVLKYNKNTRSNAKLMITPPFGELRHANWNWGLVADHMDVMDMQLQAFVNDHTLMKGYVSSTFNEMSNSKKHVIFVQVSMSRNTIQENIDAINAVKDRRIGAFLIWYQATQTKDLEKFLDNIKRD